MAERAAAVLCLASAAAALYAICRELHCGRFPAAFGAAAWVLAEAMLRPGRASGSSFAASALLIPFAFAGVFSRQKRRWPFLALALALVAWRWRPVPATAGPLEPLVLSVLAALGAQRLWDGEGGPAFLVGAAAAVAAALSRGGPPALAVWLEAIPAGAALALVASVSREFRARAGLVVLVALFGLQRAAEIRLGVAPRPSVVTAGRGAPAAR